MYSNSHLSLLRQAMEKKGIKAYLMKTGDPHNSEEPAPYYSAERRFFCPFSGDNAYVIVTEKDAILFSDGRFTLSANEEIKGTPYVFIELYRPGNPTPEEYLRNNGLYPLGVDFSYLSLADLKELRKGGEVQDVSFFNLVEDVPPLSHDPLWSFDSSAYQDHNHLEKLEIVREVMKEKGVEALLLTTLDDIAYLTNLRGNDLLNTPLFYSYAYLTLHEAHLFLASGRLEHLEGYTLHDLSEIAPFVKERQNLLTWVDEKECNASLASLLKNPFDAEVPTRLEKAVKGPKEIENIISIQEEDGVALLKFIDFLDQAKPDLTEWEVVEKLHGFRAEGKRFLDESFTTIAAMGSNAAMMHYAPTAQAYSTRNSDTIQLLLDSGGQYLGGTTDTTRTFLLGTPTPEYIRDYTLTLRSVIALSSCIFLQGANGQCIDMMAREIMWREGMDYKCGTGHGVGYLSVVHESPNGFRYRPAKGKNDGANLVPGMVTTIEPGVYKANKYGIRIENNLLCVPAFVTPDGTFYRFQTITYVPIDTKALDLTLLSDSDIAWINAYHQEVFDRLSPKVEGHLLDVLKEKTKPLNR